MSQTSYAINMATARQGQLADAGIHDIMTGYLANSGVTGVFGALMVLDTGGDYNAKPPAASGDITSVAGQLGIVVEAQVIPSNVNSPALPPYYPNQYAVPLLRKGRIWVNSETAVTKGSSGVYCRYLAASNTSVGGFSATSVASNTALLPAANYQWISSTTSTNQLAILEINLP